MSWRIIKLNQCRIAAAQLARIDPHILAVIGEHCAEVAHERVVLRAVGDEERGHGRVPG